MRLLIFLLLAAAAGVSHAHENLPASLIIQERTPYVFDVRWRVPETQGAAPEVMPVVPADCTAVSPVREVPAPGARLRQWQVKCAQGLQGGARIGFAGLELAMFEVIARVAYLDGTVESHIARTREPEVRFGQEGAQQGGQTLAQTLAVSGYFGLGVAHILSGVDHLLFVLCLIMLVPNLLALLKTITAFTLAHSLTLALAALGVVQLPRPPIEALIALSIVFLARELLRRNEGIAWQRPWAVAFAFGLLHGFGFAGALSEVGLPQGDIPMALLLFNLGVEAGQLCFVACVFPLLLLLRRFQVWPRWAGALPVYAVGAMSGFWFLQRMVPIVGLNGVLR